MPIAKISQLGSIGLNNDKPPYAIEPNAFSDGRNIRPYRGKLRNFNGYTTVTTAPADIYDIFVVEDFTGARLWLECGLTAVYAYDGLTHFDITRGTGTTPYTMDGYNDRWTAGVVNQLGFLCNGRADGPQVWQPIDKATKLVDMNYDPNAAPGSQTWEELNYDAFAMRGYSSVIVALATRIGTAQPNVSRVQWSDFISPGDTNTDWVATPTNSAGAVDLGNTNGSLIDAAPLRDDLIIYKEDAVFRMSPTGVATDPFTFDRLPDYVRLINRNCIGVAEEMHVIASTDDINVFDGNNFRSLLTGRMREYYQTLMFDSRILTTFVSVLNSESEVWICFPTQGNVGEEKFPDLAIVWNYRDNTIGLTDLPQCKCMDEGTVLDESSDLFDDNGRIFDEMTAEFDEGIFKVNRNYQVGAFGTSVALFGAEPTEDGTPRQCFAERMGLVLQDEKNGIASTDRVHTLRTFRPYLQSTGPVTLQLGAQMSPYGPITWEPEQTFDPKTQDEVQSRATGRFFGYRLRSNSNIIWDLTDAEFEYKLRRRR